MVRGCRNYLARTSAVWKLGKKHKTKKVESGRWSKEPLQYPASTEKTMRKAVENPDMKITKKPNERCKDVLTFLETGDVSLSENKNYQVSVSIGLNSS